MSKIKLPPDEHRPVSSDNADSVRYGFKYSSRRQRKSAVKKICNILSSIRDAERKCINSMPLNLQSSVSFEAGEYALDALDDIIDLLADVY